MRPAQHSPTQNPLPPVTAGFGFRGLGSLLCRQPLRLLASEALGVQPLGRFDNIIHPIFVDHSSLFQPTGGHPLVRVTNSLPQ